MLLHWLHWSRMNCFGCEGIMSLTRDCMDDRSVREGIDGEESHVVHWMAFMKCHLMNVHTVLATYYIWLDWVAKCNFELILSSFSHNYSDFFLIKVDLCSILFSTNVSVWIDVSLSHSVKLGICHTKVHLDHVRLICSCCCVVFFCRVLPCWLRLYFVNYTQDRFLDL